MTRRSGALAIPSFRHLLFGQAISQFGDALYYLVFVFMVDRLTGSAAMVGYVAAVQGLPFLVLAPLAGAIADRVDRRRLMLGCDLASAALLLAFCGLLLVQPKPPVASIFVVGGLLSVINVFFLPAKSAALPRLVPGDLLLQANGLSAAVQNVMPLIGIASSAIVLGGLSMGVDTYFFPIAVAGNAVTFLASALYIAKLPAVRPQREDGKEPPMREALDGLRLIGRNPILRTALATAAGMHAFVAPFLVVYVVANREWFDGTYRTLATFETGFVGAMVVASLTVSRMRITRPGLCFAFANMVVGLTVAAMAFSPRFWPFLFWNVAAGLALPFATVPMTTMIQLIVADEYRGRVNGAFAMATMGMLPLGNAVGGAALGALGLQNMFLLMGLGMFVVVGLGLVVPEFRGARMPTTAS